ncbi:hypothetical protein BASA60_000369 [Batrachochytrium salamandrivorans]|nr:hypothetical protein BASA60_000369 [Batrachochytrium salamandrivorans]
MLQLFPQPAGLSEKYSNNADATLASDLEARSYQPALNFQKDSATSMSMKQREDSGSDSSPPPDTTPDETVSIPFTKNEISSENLASTIDSVGDGIVGLFKKGEKVIEKIDGDTGEMVVKYIRREAYVNAVLAIWLSAFLKNTVSNIKSSLSNNEYSKIEPEFIERLEELQPAFSTWSRIAVEYTTKILNEEGTVIENVKYIRTAFYSASSVCLWIFSELQIQLLKFKAGLILGGYLAKIVTSIEKFNKRQLGEYRDEILKALGDKSSQ